MDRGRPRRRPPPAGRQLRQTIFFWLAGALVLLLWFGSPLADLAAQSIVSGISPSDDIALGRAAVRGQRYRYLPSGPVERAGRRVLSAASNHGHADQVEQYEWSFQLIEGDGVANAFAVPGGGIFVTSDLLELVDEVRLNVLFESFRHNSTLDSF